MKEKTPRQRILSYLFLILVCKIVQFVIPYIISLTIHINERVMTLALIPTILIINFTFSLVFLEIKPTIKYALPLLISIFVFLGLKYLLPLSIIHDQINLRYFGGFTLAHIVIALPLWELSYRILDRLADRNLL